MKRTSVGDGNGRLICGWLRIPKWTQFSANITGTIRRLR